MKKFGLHSNRVVTPDGLQDVTLFIDQNEIVGVENGLAQCKGFKVVEHGNDVIMPGLIDPHVHINEPGRTDWEGFSTATKAAAAGGITSLIDMPLNSYPVTTNIIAFRQKLISATTKVHVNVGFWGGLVPDNLGDLEALLQSGVLGIKAFLTHSGIEEFPNVKEKHLRKALPILKKYQVPILVHCELDEPHDGLDFLDKHPNRYMAYLKSRPRCWEDNAIQMMINLGAEFEARVHIVHLSSSNSIDPMRRAKEAGQTMTVETCPHYLYFNAEDISNGDTIYKCAPPIREFENNQQLWQALKEGFIDFIASDHSPSPPELKEVQSGDFKKAWGGIAGLQFGLPAVWTKAREKGFSIEDMAKLMSTNVAQFLNWDKTKGKLAEGYDADILIWQPEVSFEVVEKDTQHRHKLSPYLGETLYGKVKQTYVMGFKVFDQGRFMNLSKGQIIIKPNQIND